MQYSPATDPGHNPASRQVARRSGLPRTYVVAWVALAAIASSYLGVVAVRSGIEPAGLIARATPGTVATAPAPDTTAAKVTAEVLKLRQSLKDFQADIGHARIDLESRGQDQSLVASLTAIEERMSLETGMPLALAPAAAAQPTPAPVAPAPVAAVIVNQPAAPATVVAAAKLPPAQDAPPVPTPVAVVKPAPAPALEPFALAPASLEKLMQPLETGSLAAPPKPAGLPKAIPGPGMPAPAPLAAATPAATPQAAPIAFGPAIVKAEPKPYAVQLASGPTLDSIKLSWSLLSDQHSDTLRNLQPRFKATGTEEAGQTFDLVAGPIKTAADAKKLCKALAARGTDCKVSPFTGEGL